VNGRAFGGRTNEANETSTDADGSPRQTRSPLLISPFLLIKRGWQDEAAFHENPPFTKNLVDSARINARIFRTGGIRR
jgi:hypothetical protein